jgi:hypothetical protein
VQYLTLADFPADDQDQLLLGLRPAPNPQAGETPPW